MFTTYKSLQNHTLKSVIKKICENNVLYNNRMWKANNKTQFYILRGAKDILTLQQRVVFFFFLTLFGRVKTIL